MEGVDGIHIDVRHIGFRPPARLVTRSLSKLANVGLLACVRRLQVFLYYRRVVQAKVGRLCGAQLKMLLSYTPEPREADIIARKLLQAHIIPMMHGVPLAIILTITPASTPQLRSKLSP